MSQSEETHLLLIVVNLGRRDILHRFPLEKYLEWSAVEFGWGLLGEFVPSWRSAEVVTLGGRGEPGEGGLVRLSLPLINHNIMFRKDYRMLWMMLGDGIGEKGW